MQLSNFTRGQPVYPWIEKAATKFGLYEGHMDFADNLQEFAKAAHFRLQSMGDAWCSMFVCWCLADGGTRSAWARSYVNYGMKLNAPVYGGIVVFRRGSGGHVGFFMGKRDGKLLILGGNQDNSVCVKEYDEADVLAYRWPAFHAVPVQKQ